MRPTEDESERHRRTRAHHVRILQWNCRGFARRSAELALRLERSQKPSIWLLQETNCVYPKLTGFRSYSAPSITTRSRGRKPRTRKSEDSEEEARGSAAILVENGIPQTQINTANWCNSMREIVAVRTLISGKVVVFVSVYLRPGIKGGHDTDWIEELRDITGNDSLVIGGDFNTKHTLWGYKNNTSGGVRLVEVMESIGMELLNDLTVPTRIADRKTDRDTIPDLTWASPGLNGDWTVQLDPMGSDHLPIEITLENVERKQTHRRVKIIKWDTYRDSMACDMQNPGESSLDLSKRIRAAMKKATLTRSVKRGKPAPDMHLLNLWAGRLRELQRYRKGGKKTSQRIILNKATAKARQYSLQLQRDRWKNHCTSFNERTGLARAWKTFKQMQGPSKCYSVSQDVALKLNLTEDEFAMEAGNVFFP